MKKTVVSIVTFLFAAILIISCNSSQTAKTSEETNSKDSTKTVTAKFVDAGSLEGEAILTFEKEDGSKIDFFRNYFNEKEPKLKFDFLSKEGIGGNKDLLGSFFIIKYIEKKNGGPTGRIAEGEACNQIISIEKK